MTVDRERAMGPKSSTAVQAALRDVQGEDPTDQG